MGGVEKGVYCRAGVVLSRCVWCRAGVGGVEQKCVVYRRECGVEQEWVLQSRCVWCRAGVDSIYM